MLAWATAACIAACATAGTPTDDTQLQGTYETTLPAASGGGERTIGVMLMAEHAAAVTSAFSGRPSRFFAKGTWRRDADHIVVTLEGPRPERLVFDHADGKLIAREWDRATWGEAGPGTLAKK